MISPQLVIRPPIRRPQINVLRPCTMLLRAKLHPNKSPRRRVHRHDWHTCNLDLDDSIFEVRSAYQRNHRISVRLMILPGSKMQGFSSAVHDYVCLGIDHLQSLHRIQPKNSCSLPGRLPVPVQSQQPKTRQAKCANDLAHVPPRSHLSVHDHQVRAPSAILPLRSHDANLLAALRRTQPRSVSVTQKQIRNSKPHRAATREAASGRPPLGFGYPAVAATWLWPSDPRSSIFSETLALPHSYLAPRK